MTASAGFIVIIITVCLIVFRLVGGSPIGAFVGGVFVLVVYVCSSFAAARLLPIRVQLVATTGASTFLLNPLLNTLDMEDVFAR